jgi:hypothetical protein
LKLIFPFLNLRKPGLGKGTILILKYFSLFFRKYGQVGNFPTPISLHFFVVFATISIQKMKSHSPPHFTIPSLNKNPPPSPPILPTKGHGLLK